MKLFLLRQYVSPSGGPAGPRALALLSITAPVGLLNAWVLPEFAFWATAAFSTVMFGAVAQRPTAYEAALPISGRDLAVARLTSSFGLSLLPLLLSALTVAFRAPEKFPTLQLLQCFVLVAIGNLVPRLVRPREFAVVPGEAIYPQFGVALGATAIVSLLPSWASLLVFVSALIGVSVLWWRVTPEAFQAASPKISGASAEISTPGVRSRSTTTESAAGLLQVCRFILRSLYSKPRIFNAVFAAFAGLTCQWQLLIALFMSVDDLWLASNWMRALPFSHRARLWMILAPGVAIPMLLIVLGTQIQIPWLLPVASLRRNAVLTSDQEPRYFSSPTEISFEYWTKSPDQSAPVIIAPWGETVAPYVLHVFGRVYYNPYSTRPRSSARFTDWQFKRLTKTVLGQSISQADYDALRMKPRRLNSGWRMMILNVSTALTLAMLYLIAAGLSKYKTFWHRSVTTKVLTWSVLALPAFALLYGIFATKSADTVFALLEGQLMRLSDVLPRNNIIVLLLSLLPVAAAYSLLEWQFARSETRVTVWKV